MQVLELNTKDYVIIEISSCNCWFPTAQMDCLCADFDENSSDEDKH